MLVCLAYMEIMFLILFLYSKSCTVPDWEVTLRNIFTACWCNASSTIHGSLKELTSTLEDWPLILWAAAGSSIHGRWGFGWIDTGVCTWTLVSPSSAFATSVVWLTIPSSQCPGCDGLTITLCYNWVLRLWAEQSSGMLCGSWQLRERLRSGSWL